MMQLLTTAVGHGRSTQPLDLLAILTLLAIVPFFVVMTTSFVRIVVVLSLMRQAVGTPSIPPNIVITGVALILSFAIMSPTLRSLSSTALAPYQQGKIDQRAVLERSARSLEGFMLRQTHRTDIETFARIAQVKDRDARAMPFEVTTAAFVTGELRDAFAIGFALYLPFLAIDLAVSAILMSLGMMMLSPTIVSLPCKLLLFFLVDGWGLILNGVATSFR